MTQGTGTSQEQYTLQENTVQIWFANLRQPAQSVDRYAALISADERMRASRFRSVRDRDDYIICRGVLRLLLSRYIPVSPARIGLTYGSHGKPQLDVATLRMQDCATHSLCFNLSHSNGLALFGFTRGRDVGVDVEQVRPMPHADAIVHRFFSETERLWYQAAPASEQQRRFFALWTRKEAFLKATGSGLSRSLSDFDVVGKMDGSEGLIPVQEAGLDGTPWSIRDVSVDSTCTAAVCTTWREWQVLSFRIDHVPLADQRA